jgi:hypothetical protein
LRVRPFNLHRPCSLNRLTPKSISSLILLLSLRSRSVPGSLSQATKERSLYLPTRLTSLSPVPLSAVPATDHDSRNSSGPARHAQPTRGTSHAVKPFSPAASPTLTVKPSTTTLNPPQADLKAPLQPLTSHVPLLPCAFSGNTFSYFPWLCGPCTEG